MINALQKKLQEQLLIELEENAQFNQEASFLFEQIKQVAAASAAIPEDLFKDALFFLSTIRNRNLITSAEQKKLQETVVGFFGLSVGSNAVLPWILESRADVVKIADPDTISPSNLNRLVYGWDSVGKRKIDAVKERALAIHPYLTVISSLNEKNEDIAHLFHESPALAVVVDSIDSLEGKILLRKFARSTKIPLIMATDVGDNVILDIERHDLQQDLDYFLGRAPGIDQVDITALSPKQRFQYVLQIVGLDKNSEAMLDSLLSVGKTLATWPQLGATATIAGGTIATAIKKIVLGENVESGRYYIALDELLVSDFNSDERKKRRKSKIDALKKL